MALNQRRMISSQIWENEKFALLTSLEQLLYMGMITIADDEGRFKAEPRYLKHKILIFKRIGESKIQKITEKIEEVNLIETYQTKKCRVGFHPNWTKYQTLRADRLKLSEFPPPPTTVCQPNDNQVTAEDKISKDNIREDKISKDKGLNISNKTDITKQAIPEGNPFREILNARCKDNDDSISAEDIPF